MSTAGPPVVGCPPVELLGPALLGGVLLVERSPLVDLGEPGFCPPYRRERPKAAALVRRACADSTRAGKRYAGCVGGRRPVRTGEGLKPFHVQ